MSFFFEIVDKFVRDKFVLDKSGTLYSDVYTMLTAKKPTARMTQAEIVDRQIEIVNPAIWPARPELGRISYFGGFCILCSVFCVRRLTCHLPQYSLRSTVY